MIIRIDNMEKFETNIIANELTNSNNWFDISINYELSEEFIRKFQNKVIWHYICQYQKLSESFIMELKNKVSWLYISRYQKLSEKFILYNYNLLEPRLLLCNCNITGEIKTYIKNKLNHD